MNRGALLGHIAGWELDLKGKFLSNLRGFLALGAERKLILQILWVSTLKEGDSEDHPSPAWSGALPPCGDILHRDARLSMTVREGGRNGFKGI